MKRTFRAALLCALSWSPFLTFAEDPTDEVPAVSKSDVKAAIDRAARVLREAQREDGSYGSQFGDVGITALVVHALADCPRAYREGDGPYISKAVEYLLVHQQEDGGIYNPGQGLRNYKTSVSILALSALDRDRPKKRYQTQLERARAYVAGLQCDEESRPTPFDPVTNRRAYGGIGYGSDLRPDLSNTQFALEALHAARLAEDSDVWQKAVRFVSRCQNLEAHNDLLKEEEHRSTEDGGFFYAPGETKAERIEHPDGSVSYSSYGSMTYAGIKSYIYAGLERDDPRVAAAWKWVLENYTLDENPGMATKQDPRRGQMGLYYYYVVFARTLEVLGDDVLETADRKKHRWASELAAKLLSLQQPDGRWVNPVDRWWEGDPAVTTAYAVRALSIAYDRMK